MRSLDDIIRFEGESTAVDFKAIPYARSQHEAFLRDVMSMANADTEEPRLIIAGVKLRADGTRDILGVDPTALPDPAIFQQLVRENIEPDITLESFSHVLDGKTFAILRIPDGPSQPYLMRKDFLQLRRGDGMIRKGTHQARLDRADLERIYAARDAQRARDHKLAISFAGTEGQKVSLIHAAVEKVLPSVRAERQIREELAARKRGKQPKVDQFAPIMKLMGVGRPYETRTTEELNECLKNLAWTFREDDAYAMHEQDAALVSVEIFNGGDSYLTDGLLYVGIRELDGLHIADAVHQRPDDKLQGRGITLPVVQLPGDYPSVTRDAMGWLVRAPIGILRHKHITPAFHEALRVKAAQALVGRDVVLHCALHAKELRNPVEQDLVLRVAAPRTS